MECKFAIKYGNKRLYLGKMYPRLTSSVQEPEVVEQLTSSNELTNSTTSGFLCTDEGRRGYIFTNYTLHDGFVYIFC